MSGITVRAGSRVYWHGVFPNPSKQGTVTTPGTIRHEVRWDGSEQVSLVPVTALAKILGGKPVCPYAPEVCGYCSPPV